MKKRIAERVLVLIVSMAVLLTSTGVYSVFAENDSTSLSGTETTSSSTTISAAQNEKEQDTTIPAKTPENSTEKIETDNQDTQPKIVSEGGAVEFAKIQGEGTADKPYMITSAEDFIKMQDIINDTTSSDKFFALTNDIDLSSVSYAQLQGNKVMPGTLVSINKALSDAAPNSVKFVLNGQNHKIYGLDVTNTGSSVAAIFGYVNAKSTIKYINFEDCSIKTTYKDSVAEALIAVYNNGEIRDCKLNNLSINAAENVDATISGCNIQKDFAIKNSTGLIAVNNGRVSNIVATGIKINVASDKQKVGALVGINAGFVSNVSVSADIKAETSTAGVLVGSNSGRVLFSSAQANAQLGNKAVFGAVTGESSGIIESCVATGKATGTAYCAGIVGKAFSENENEITALVRSSYSFMKTPASSELGGLVADGKVKSENNFWSSEESGRATAFAEDTCDDMLATTRLIVLKENETKTFNKSVLSSTWGKATQAFDFSKNLSVASGNVKLTESDKEFTLKAGSVNTASVITYNAKVSVNAGYNNATALNRTQKIVVLTVSKDSKGNGLSPETALTISNSAELLMIKAAPFANFVLTNNIDMPEDWSPVIFRGSLNGAGYAINASKPLFSADFGTVTDLDVVLNNTVNTAMFGKANGATFVNVQLLKGQNEDSEVFVGVEASNNSTGAFLNVVRGKTVIENCFTNVPICAVKEDVKIIAGFIGYLASSCAVIKNSGASTSITYKQANASAPEAIEKIENSAAFIGYTQENKDGVIENCYATIYSTLTPFAFIGGGSDKIKAENIYFGSSNNESVATPASFKEVNATKWSFDAGENGYIAGKGSVVSITLPQGIIDPAQVKASDFSALYDAGKLKVNTSAITLKGNVIYLPVEAASAGVTVQNSSVTLVHNGTGLRATISLSNGLEKDENGNYIIYYGVDFVFVGDNFEDYKDASFVLANDIDMSGIDFAPMGGSAYAFSGTLDGCGHKITSLKVNATAKSALFGALDGATVKNITFENAEINATGSYAAVLAGQIVGDSKLSALTFKNVSVKCSENYAGILAGGTDGATVKNIIIDNCKVDAVNYTSAFAGEIKNSTVESAKVVKSSVNGDKYVGVLAGFATNTGIKTAQVEDCAVVGEKFVGGVAGTAENSEFNAVNLNGLTASSKAASLEESAIVGGFAGEFGGKVINSSIVNSTVIANGKVSVAGGVVGFANGAEINGVTIGEKVSVNGAVSGGFIGDATKASVVNSTSFTEVNGSKASSKATLGAGGVIGRVSAEDFALINVKNVNVSGSVTAYDSVGGIIGSVISEKATAPSIENCVVAATLKAVASENAVSGFVIGNVAKLSAEDIKSSVSKVIFSSYASSFGAYGTVDAPATYCDLDKSVNSSLTGAIKNNDEITVSVSNADADKYGFVFNGEWKSESDSRVAVLESTENSVTLQASGNGIVAIVGSYKLAENDKIQLKVHFDAEVDLALKLNGEGTKENPYIISTPAEIEAVAEYAQKSAYFTVTKDIIFTPADFAFGGEFYNKGNGFTPIGTKEAPFNGTIIGNGHTISGIVINNADFGGLFGAVSGAEINGLNITDITVNAKEMASAVAAKAVNSVINNVNVTKAVLDTESAQGSVAVVAAYAQGCRIDSVKITECVLTAKGESFAYSLACVGSVCARAIDTKISEALVDGKTTLEANGTAGGFTAYCENVTITASETFADVNGVDCAAVAGNVNGVLTVKNIVAGGKINASRYAGGISAKANAPVKADNVVISAVVNGEEATGVVIGLANKSIFADSDKTEVKFNKIVYSDYQNDAGLFADEEINAYQSADYLAGITNVNRVTSAKGDFVAVGAKALKVSDAVMFGVNMSDYTLETVASAPENLVSYNSADNTVTATATDINNAKLVLKYTNGLEVAVDMVTVKGMTGEGTNEAPYIINNEETVLLLSVFPNAVFEITNDITLTENWTPVKDFSGKLNGKGFTIKNLKVQRADGGLFETLNGSAEVDGVAFEGADINSNSVAGVVCANLKGNAKLRNIKITNSTVTAKDFAGMVVGCVDSSDAEISLCTVTDGTANASNAAGIAAEVNGDAKIENSAVVAGSINAKRTAGGIVALADARSLKINGCDFSGEVNGEKAGGIVGVAQAPAYVDACSADGNITGTYCEGGIIGLAEAGSSVTNSKAAAKLSGNAKHTAEIVAKFSTLPEDNEDFAAMFSGNTTSGEYDAFESAVMKYQNYVPTAQEEQKITLKGSGTSEDPYIIEKATDLLQIPDGSTQSFALEADIAFTVADYSFTADESGNTVYGEFEGGFKPIQNFAGEFNGNGHKITGLYINNGDNFAGLFAKVTGNGSVKNLHIEVLEEKDGFGFFGINGRSYVGAIAGYCDSTKGIDNCSVAGGVIKGEKSVGGLVGGLASSKILNSFALCEIKAQNNAGGFAGVVSGISTISNGFAACTVNAAGGSAVGNNNGRLEISDVLLNGTSYGGGSVAVGVNNGTLVAERVIVAGTNSGEKSAVMLADEAENVYSDITKLSVADKNIKALTTKELTSSIPEGLNGWTQTKGNYPVPLMADDYSKAKALIACVPAQSIDEEDLVGNVQFNYTLSNKTGDSSVDSILAGVLIKSRVNDATITSDFFTTCNGTPVKVNKLLVTTGGFYIDSSLPAGYDFEITATDSNGNRFTVSDAGSMGSYVEIGAAEYVNVQISIVKTDIPWGLTSLWESLVR